MALFSFEYKSFTTIPVTFHRHSLRWRKNSFLNLPTELAPMTGDAPSLDELTLFLEALDVPSSPGVLTVPDDSKHQCLALEDATVGLLQFDWPPLDVTLSTVDQALKKDTPRAQRPRTLAEQRARESSLAAKRRYRVKRKNELLDLRTACAQLTTRLKALEQKEEAVNGQLSQSGYARGLRLGWRGVALRQLRRKLDAETLNRQLWKQIRSHCALAEHLSSVLRMRMSAVDTERVATLTDKVDKPTLELSDADRKLIAVFMNELDALYCQAEMAATDLDYPSDVHTAYSMQHFLKWDHHSQSKYVEFNESFVIPFALADAVRFLPKALTATFSRDCNPAIMADSNTDDTFAVKFQFDTSDDEQQQTIYKSTAASKMICEANRAVLLWRSLTERPDIGSQYMESGWGIMRSLPNNGSDRTLVQFCTRIRPLHWTNVLPSEVGGPRWDEYLELMVKHGEDEAIALTHAIENAVMDELATARVQV